MLILTNSLCLDCEVPEAPTNGHVSLPEGTYLADIALYDCDPGYTRVGPSTRMCEETGEWSGEQPDCLVIGKYLDLFTAKCDWCIGDCIVGGK